MRIQGNEAAFTLLVAIVGTLNNAVAFTFVPRQLSIGANVCRHHAASSVLVRKGECVSRDGKDPSDEDGDENKSKYPFDLEFIDYDDPNYSVDQGFMEGEEYYNPSTKGLNREETEAEVEKMREERRVQNDIFQFNTYFKNFVEEKTWKGLWLEYRTSTFMDNIDDKDKFDANGIPKLARGRAPIQVVSTASRQMLEPWGPESEVIVHKEEVNESKESKGAFCPPLRQFDFRGHQGNMCVGNAYAVCDTKTLESNADDDHVGPYSEFRVELGIQYEGARMRLKLEYSIKDDERVLSETPILHLKNMIVCRERDGVFPSESDDNLLGAPGAPGGLYDPPPVGGEDQSFQYMCLDLEGHASALFPYAIDQTNGAFDNGNWCITLDWTPGKMRYQLDRKFFGGSKIKGLKTLELSEVQSGDAESWRPNSGPTDMRQ